MPETDLCCTRLPLTRSCHCRCRRCCLSILPFAMALSFFYLACATINFTPFHPHVHRTLYHQPKVWLLPIDGYRHVTSGHGPFTSTRAAFCSRTHRLRHTSVRVPEHTRTRPAYIAGYPCCARICSTLAQTKVLHYEHFFVRCLTYDNALTRSFRARFSSFLHHGCSNSPSKDQRHHHPPAARQCRRWKQLQSFHPVVAAHGCSIC